MPTPVDDPDSSASSLVAALRQQLHAELVETHISWVLLDGRQAWKIKKPVNLGFLDFRDRVTRQRLCLEELRLNRRLAPSLYLDVVAIRGTPTEPRLEGDGAAIDYAVRMKQFPSGALLIERLQAGTLKPAHLDQLAQRLARFHAAADVAPASSTFGTPSLIEGTTLSVLDGLSQRGCGADCARLRQWVLAQGKRLHPIWMQRKAGGRIREGHGDLHLANAVVLSPDEVQEDVTAFDCLEFDPALRWIDVLSDIAFLMMDLMAHSRSDWAFRFLNVYLDASGDQAGLPVLRYYLVYRALVRALINCIRATSAQPCTDTNYLALAQGLTQASDARLLITSGLSGSGKSAASQRLLESTQALRLRADVERKRLFGLEALASSASRVPGGIYGVDATARTFARLRELAASALAAGYRVIVDAAFLRAAEREDFRRLASDLGVPFTILHCVAPVQTLRQRIEQRQRAANDASEADLAVLDHQLSNHEPLTPAEQAYTLTLDTSSDLDLAGLSQRWMAAR